jgi:hypothetical protein
VYEHPSVDGAAAVTLYELIAEWRKPCTCYYECSCSGDESCADQLEELIGKPPEAHKPTPVRGICTVCHEAIIPGETYWGFGKSPDFHYH